MSATQPNYFHLRFPPVVEAIVDIDCDLPPGIDFNSLEGPARDSLRDKYPQLQKRTLHQFQIRQEGDRAPEHELSDGGLNAFLFRSTDGQQLTQFRRNGYSFNRLAPYGGMDAYLEEIQRTWENYRGIAKPLRIRKIGLRTINRLPLPTNVSGLLRLEEYLSVGPQLPPVAGRNLNFTGFLNQHQVVDGSSGLHANIVLASEGLIDGKYIVLLDIDVFEPKPQEELDWANISPTISALRSLKNDLFRNIVTQQCLNLFSSQS